MSERELIFKGGFTKGGTASPEEERQPNLTQQLALESPKRATIWTNSPNLDHH